MPGSGPHVFCFGLGYVGLKLVASLQAQGWRVSGTVRDPQHVMSLRLLGINARLFDDPLDMSDVSHILSTIPPDAPAMQGDIVDPVCRRIILRRADCSSVGWFGYLSTTGVYGNTDGVVVNEDSPLNPSSQRAKSRVVAEKNWQDLAITRGLPAHIFRLPGIYGPARSAFDQFQANRLRRIHKPGHLFNRVHVDDIIQVLCTAMEHPQTDNQIAITYNVADDLACEPSEIARYACDLMGVEPPPLVAFDEAAKSMSAMALSFWQDNRRISNHKIKSDLGVKLRYPDYRRGLDAIWQSMNS